MDNFIKIREDSYLKDDKTSGVDPRNLAYLQVRLQAYEENKAMNEEKKQYITNLL